MVSDQTNHHPMGVTTKADEYSTAQTGYHKRSFSFSCPKVIAGLSPLVLLRC